MKWDVDKTHGVMWIASEAAKSAVGSMKDMLGTRFTELLCYNPNHEFQWCTLEDENEKIGLFLVQKFKDKKFSDKYVQDYRNFDKISIKELNDLDRKDLSKLSIEELFKALEKSTGIYIKNFDFGFIIEPMDFVLPNIAEKALIKKGYTHSEIADMTSVADTTFLNVEMQNLITIAKSSRELQLPSLKHHAYEYRWIQTAHLGKKDILFSNFESRLDELRKKSSKELDAELNHLKNLEENVKQKKSILLKRKPVDKETRQILDIIALITPFHDMRKEIFMRSIYTSDYIREEIAKRFGYTREEISVFEVKELKKLQEGKKIDKDYAHELTRSGLLYVNTKTNVWEYMVGKEAEAFAKKELTVDISGMTEILGTIASLGIAKGRVKIIHGFNEMSKMEKGDVLVTSMTRPEIIPAMRKASAIVTDEGGVTCHAAIVSRELGIPCIIGTKIASSVLKDNDFVEIDANKGVIKIIKGE